MSYLTASQSHVGLFNYPRHSILLRWAFISVLGTDCFSAGSVQTQCGNQA